MGFWRSVFGGSDKDDWLNFLSVKDKYIEGIKNKITFWSFPELLLKYLTKKNGNFYSYDQMKKDLGDILEKLVGKDETVVENESVDDNTEE